MHGAYDGSVYMHNTLRRFLILSFPDAMEPSDPSKPRNHDTPHAPSKRCSMELTRTRRLLGAAGVVFVMEKRRPLQTKGFFRQHPELKAQTLQKGPEQFQTSGACRRDKMGQSEWSGTNRKRSKE